VCVWFIIYVKKYNTISNKIGYRWAESGRVGTTRVEKGKDG
jgi:hypothetical protein